jgi:hypothetical protein
MKLTKDQKAITMCGLVGTGTGLTTAYLNRKKYKNGWGKTILFSGE